MGISAYAELRSAKNSLSNFRASLGSALERSKMMSFEEPDYRRLAGHDTKTGATAVLLFRVSVGTKDAATLLDYEFVNIAMMPLMP